MKIKNLIKLTFFVLLAGLLLMSCISMAHRSLEDVSEQCQKEGRYPGQIVVTADIEYVCPMPEATPTVLYFHLSPESICDKPESWQDPRNSIWLDLNVLGPASSWKYEDGLWVYTFVRIQGDYMKWVDGFRYPGFGVFKVYLYVGGVKLVKSGDDFPERLDFTKLELSCQ